MRDARVAEPVKSLSNTEFKTVRGKFARHSADLKWIIFQRLSRDGGGIVASDAGDKNVRTRRIISNVRSCVISPSRSQSRVLHNVPPYRNSARQFHKTEPIFRRSGLSCRCQFLHKIRHVRTLPSDFPNASCYLRITCYF